MKLIVVNTPEDAGIRAAQEYAALLKEKPACVLGFATGSTPLPLYNALAQSGLDFSRVHTVNLDEYKGLAPDHPQSYRRFMNENLFDRINIPAENTRVPDGLAQDPGAMCRAYEQHIAALGGIDLQLLGIGHDGHIGFNEPDDHFPAMTHETPLTPMTREANSRFFAKPEDVPTAAYTMGVGTVMAARRILMIVTGADKREILHKALYGKVTPRVPASVLQFHQNTLVICDKAAMPEE